MTREVVTVAPELPLKQVAELLVRHAISGVPVCRAGKVVGVVSEADILRVEEGFDPQVGRVLGWILRKLDGELDRVRARTAAEAMSSPAVVARPLQSVADVARLMVERRVNRLPVVNRSEELVGVVSRADLVRAFVRSDADVEHEIRTEVIERLFMLSATAFSIEVADGQVSISGFVDSADDGEAILRRIRAVPGVLGVDANIVARPPQRATFEVGPPWN